MCFYLDWRFRKQFCLRALSERGFILSAFGAMWHAVYAIEMGAFPNWGNLSAMFICTQDVVGVSLSLNVISLCQHCLVQKLNWYSLFFFFFSV